jgi:hypothetical protein
MKYLFYLFIFSFSSTSAYSQQTHKEQVLQTVKDYALASSCHTTFEKSEDNNFGNPNYENIYVSYTTIENIFQGINNYFVLWGGYDNCDIAATGENYTYSLTEVAYSEQANRFIIKNSNVIVDVEDEPFFTLANIKLFEQLDTGTYKVSLNMFKTSDIDKKTNGLKEKAIPNYYILTLTEHYSDGYLKHKVLNKVKVN